MPRFLIVDDSNAVREQLRRLVERNPEWQVCAQAQNGREAVDRALLESPDIVLLDYRLPLISGLQAAREISRLLPQARILLCSMHISLDLSEAAREAGCHGAVSKYDARQITAAIAALLRQENFFSAETISSW